MMPLLRPRCPPLLALSDELFFRLGVPEDCLPLVKAVTTEEALELLEKRLPLEAYEALYLLAAGASVDEILAEYGTSSAKAVDPTDYVVALQHPNSLRRFHVIEDELELIQMLEAPLERWRIFLHPSQRELVARHWNGPVRVLGGAGTGKTVVAMHRAHWLVRHVLYSNEKLLFTTFTRNLAVDIQTNLQKICSPELFKCIEVCHLDEWVSQFAKRNGYAADIVYPGGADGHYEQCWKMAMHQKPENSSLPDSFYREEWQRVVLSQRVTERQGYLQASRLG